ncbi:MAG: rhamnulokinase [Bacteroidales bacterium]
MNHYLAVDIGAESGRIILGTIENNQLSMREIHRFPNGMVNINNHYHWNIAGLFTEILKGIEICIHKEQIIPDSIGIDTWGVDYGLLAEDGTLMGLPFAYRDQRTESAINEFCEKISKKEIYFSTGNHFASYNTLFQLYAARKTHPKILDAATDLLFIPDLLAYFLTGVKKTEFSFATTTQLYNRSTDNWDSKLFDILGISTDIMQEVVAAGNLIGKLNHSVCKKINAPEIPVIAVATHDTASAIAAIPASSANWAFISSGTWSLMGIQTEKAIISEKSFQMNFTNEGGIEGRNYLLKNLMGLWILQQCRQAMKMEGYDYDYSVLTKMAEEAKPFYSFIDIDHSSFLNPENMNTAIKKYCSETSQLVPSTHGQIARIVLESLAFKYSLTLTQLREFNEVEELLITGGGINNKLLCQFTANSCKIPVITALSEGTAAGNIMAQALGAKKLKSQKDIRSIIAASCSKKTYIPAETEKWDEAYIRYLSVINKKTGCN